MGFQARHGRSSSPWERLEPSQLLTKRRGRVFSSHGRRGANMRSTAASCSLSLTALLQQAAHVLLDAPLQPPLGRQSVAGDRSSSSTARRKAVRKSLVSLAHSRMCRRSRFSPSGILPSFLFSLYRPSSRRQRVHLNLQFAAGRLDRVILLARGIARSGDALCERGWRTFVCIPRRKLPSLDRLLCQRPAIP